MDKSYELKYHSIEENYWWCKSRRDIITKLIDLLDIDKNAKILDIGCASGKLMKYLIDKEYTNTHGIDLSETAIKECRNSGLKNVLVADCKKTNFYTEQFDVVIASDILEHVKEDADALKEWLRILKKRGRLIIFVPAFNFLWDKHDEENMHQRRYSKKLLENSLKQAGFEIERISYWNFLLFFPVIAFKIYNKFANIRTQKEFITKLNPHINNILATILRLENLVLKKINLPFGISLFSIAKK